MAMPSDIESVCRGHLRFMQWADERVISAVEQQTAPDLRTLQHVYLGEAVWLGRIQGKPGLQLADVAVPQDIAALRAAFDAIHQAWNSWAAGVTDWDVTVPHHNSRGEEHQMPAWQITLHVSNHGSYHRGQITAALRAVGIAPPATDLIVWYRLEG